MKKYNGLRLNQFIMYCSASFKIREICENGEIVLASISKNLDDLTVRAKDVKYIYPNKDRTTKRYSLSME